MPSGFPDYREFSFAWFNDPSTGSGRGTQHVLSTASSTTLTITDKYHLFAAGDVGKLIRVILRNPTALEDFEATIVSVISPTQAVISQAPTITSTTGEAYWFASTADDTARVQAALNSTFDVTHLSSGVYIVTAPLTLQRRATWIFGDGSWRTTLLARKSVSGDVLSFTDPMSLRLEGFSVVGPGLDASSGGRLFITHSEFDNVQRLFMRDVYVRHLADTGIVIKTPILSTLLNCKVAYAAGHGFLILGGTTTDLINCYGITCVGAGIRIQDGAAIMGLAGCASETCGAGVHIQDSYSIDIDHHDCEAQLDRAPVAAAAPSLSLLAGGALAVGTYWMKVAWMHGEAEGKASAESSITTTAGNQTISASLGTVPATVYRAAIYSTVVGGGSGNEGYLETITVTPGTPGTYTRSTAFSTVGAAPPTFWYNGHSYVVSNSQKVAIRTVHSRDIPLAASRHFLVTDNSSEVAIVYPRVVQGVTTPAYDVEITAGSTDNVLDTTLAAARILDNGTRTRWSTTSPGSALGDPVTVAHGGTGTPTGSITGPGALTFAAGGTNQNITLTPSGTGQLLVGNGVTNDSNLINAARYRTDPGASSNRALLAQSKLAITTGASSGHNAVGGLLWGIIGSTNTQNITTTPFGLAGAWLLANSEASASGTISKVMGGYISAVHNSGTWTNYYGLYVAAPAGAGTITNKYALVTEANAGNVGIGTPAPTSPLHVVGLPVYANNAAAVTGGLTAGAFYRTGADPDPVCVVH